MFLSAMRSPAVSPGTDLQPPPRIDLDRSTGWVGKAYKLRPVFDALITDIKQSTVIM
jgi:hypothetical protein